MSGIDFVVLWVDSSDLAWQASFAKHKAAGCHDEGLGIRRVSEIWVFLIIGSGVWKNMRHG